MSDIFTTTLRLTDTNDLHIKAREILLNYEKTIYKSYSNYIAECIIFFDEHMKKEIESTEEEPVTIEAIRNVFEDIISKHSVIPAEDTDSDEIRNIIELNQDSTAGDFFAAMQG